VDQARLAQAADGSVSEKEAFRRYKAKGETIQTHQTRHYSAEVTPFSGTKIKIGQNSPDIRSFREGDAM